MDVEHWHPFEEGRGNDGPVRDYDPTLDVDIVDITQSVRDAKAEPERRVLHWAGTERSPTTAAAVRSRDHQHDIVSLSDERLE
jgi:hypothetical protein